MRLRYALCTVILALGGVSALAQATAPADANTGRPTTDDDIAVLRQDIQADKTDIISRSMTFTDAQSQAFWPVYRSYAHEQAAIGDQRVALIKDYAANYQTIDDAQADSYTQRAFKFQDDSLKLKKKYLKKFEQAIGAKQTAKFYQVDNRLDLLTNVQLASLMPMIK